MYKFYLLVLIVVGIISYFWVRGIDFIKEKYPDYTGDDFLNWNNDSNSDTNNHERINSSWDDNKSHTEGEF